MKKIVPTIALTLSSISLSFASQRTQPPPVSTHHTSTGSRSTDTNANANANARTNINTNNQIQHDNKASHTSRKRDHRRSKIISLSNEIIHASSTTLSKVLRGDIAGAVPADLYGQTLQQEIAACPFQSNVLLSQYINEANSTTTHINSKGNRERRMALEERDPLHDRRLYGGAQYHRTLSQFHNLIHNVPIDKSTSDEIALLLHGIPDVSNDGVNILRSVAKLSSRKMELIMDDILMEMATRVEFVLTRMWDVVEYTQLVREDITATPVFGRRTVRPHQFVEEDGDGIKEMEHDLNRFAKERYAQFVKKRIEFCYRMLREDLMAMFRFVSWDLAFGDRFESTIGADGCIVKVEGLDDDIDDSDNKMTNGDDLTTGESARDAGTLGISRSIKQKTILDRRTDEILRSVVDAVQATVDKSGTGESMGQTCAAINVLVRYVTDRWRRDVSQMVMTKFNAYCMLPLHEDFLGYLRREMDVYLNEKYL